MRFRSLLRFCLVAGLVYFSPMHLRASDAQGFDDSRDQLHGSILSAYCKGPTDIDAGVCAGYILALAEAMLGGQRLYGQRACGHDGIRAQQLVDLVRVDRIMAQSFPCFDDIAPAAGGR
jgi:hypothetical protein